MGNRHHNNPACYLYIDQVRFLIRPPPSFSTIGASGKITNCNQNANFTYIRIY